MNLPPKLTIYAVATVSVLLMWFQNCGSFKSPTYDPVSTASPFKTDGLFDWTRALASEPKTTFYVNSDTQSVLSYFGPDDLIISSDRQDLLLYHLPDETVTRIAHTGDGEITYLLSYPQKNKIFYMQSDATNGKSFLYVYDGILKKNQSLLEIKGSCMGYSAEPRFTKLLCPSPHPSRYNEVLANLVDVDSLSVATLASAPTNLNLKLALDDMMYDLRYQYLKGTFLFPKANRATLRAMDLTSKTIKTYLFTETGVTEWNTNDVDNFWGDGRAMKLNLALAEVAPNPAPGAKETMCSGINFSGELLTAAQSAVCTPAGMFLSTFVDSNGYKYRVCSTSVTCEFVTFSDQDLVWSKFATSLYSADRSEVILKFYTGTTNGIFYRIFRYNFKSKSQKIVLGQYRQPDLTTVTSPAATDLFFVTSSQFFKTEHGADRASIIYDRTTLETIPLPRAPVSLLDLYAQNIVKEDSFYAAIMYSPTILNSDIFALTSEYKVHRQSQFQVAGSFRNRFEESKVAYLQRLYNGQVEIHRWNLHDNTTQKLFSVIDVPAYPQSDRVTLFENEHVTFVKRPVTGSRCRIEIRAPGTYNIIKEIDLIPSASCSAFGAFATSTALIYAVEKATGKADLYSFDYATKTSTLIGETLNGSGPGVIELAEKYVYFGNMIFDREGRLIMSTEGSLVDVHSGQGDVFYQVKSSANPDLTTSYQVIAVNVSSKNSTVVDTFQSNDRTMLPTADYNYKAVRIDGGISLTYDGRTTELKGALFSPIRNKFIYARKNAGGTWDFVEFDFTRINAVEKVLTSAPTYGELLNLVRNYLTLAR